MSRVKALRVACAGERQPHIKTSEFSTYDIPSDHPIFTEGEVSELSVLVRMPLLLRKVRPSLVEPKFSSQVFSSDRNRSRHAPERPPVPSATFAYREDAKYHSNEMATTLMTRFGDSPLVSAPTEWTERVGSVLIARQDGRDLHMLHISVLLGFFTATLQQESPISEALQPGVFRAYYRAALQSFGQSDSKWDSSEMVPSPFEEEKEVHPGDVVMQEGGVQV